MDREKVIAWLADEELYYRDHGDTHNSLMACYALALLKEQEAVEPKKTAYQRADHTIAYRYRCGTCDMSIFPSFKYCPFCGQAVKWNEIN